MLGQAPGLSLRKLHELLATLGEDVGPRGGSGHQSLSQALGTLLAIITPFGALLQSMVLKCVDGAEFVWTYVHPFALLHILCSKFKAFATFLTGCTRHAPEFSFLALYSDETVLGNPMRPDTDNQVQCFYWTLLQLPAWFRCKKHGWFLLATISTSIQEKLDGGLTYVFQRLLKDVFFQPASFNFSIGVPLPDGRGGSCLHRVEMGPFIQDEKAQKNTNSVKGAAGTRCCLMCRNILNIDPQRILHHPYFKHYATAKYESFHLHTAESFWKSADMLACAVNSGAAQTHINALEQALGIKYAKNGLVWDAYLRRHYNPVLQTFWDWMHCLYGAGGYAQFEVNLFVKELVRIGKTLEQLDEFAQSICNLAPKLKPHFFQTRSVMEKGEQTKKNKKTQKNKKER